MRADIFCPGFSEASISQIPHHQSKYSDFFDETGERLRGKYALLSEVSEELLGEE